MRPLRVFLCHASQDKPAVRKLHRYLKQHGIKPWLDEIDLLPGENWEVEIPRALNTSDVILVCLSKNSVNKEGYVQREISFALYKALEKPDGTIFIIPARLEDCEVPERLNRYHWVDLFRPDSNKRLLLGLNKRALDLGSDVSPVIVDDTRKRLPIVKPPDQDVLEKAKRAAQEKEEREMAERIQRAKDELEAQEKIKREVSENAAREKLKRETARLAQEEKEKSGRETAEKNAREKLVSARKAALEKEEREAKSKKQREFIPANFLKFNMGGIVLFVLIFGGLSLNYLINNLPITTPTVSFPKDTATPESPTSTSVSFTSTPQPTETPSPTSILDIGRTEISAMDGMTLLYVPEGEFLMGSTAADSLADSDEKPQHSVMVDAFWIDQTEVTNAMYAKCAVANQCDPPDKKVSYTRSNYYGNSEFDNYPVIYVSWNDALAYCSWAGRELPTEAQWEKAARGTDGRIYPWGNETPSSKLLNYNGSDTTVVKNYPNTKSFYGTYDMAGNVWEWVNDWYQSDYYVTLGDNVSNPQGPASGDVRVLRGGSWLNYSGSVRSANRSRFDPTNTVNDIGFRCSRSP